MYPPILLLHPAWARLLITYRWRRLQQAKVPSSYYPRIYLVLHQPIPQDYANSTGWAGARFPWESAR